jgi:putative SOS response-associated peptidase YedK
VCARFQTPAQSAVERYWSLVEPLWRYQQSWRVLPTDPVPVILTLDGVRTGRMMRWDLIPFRSHGVPTGKVLINAKAENLTNNYFWQGPWLRQQRCIFPMAGFYEPHRYADGRKEPFYVHLADRGVFGVAGIWDRSLGADGTPVLSCTLITTAANALLAEVHNEKRRMPAVLREQDHEAWLSGDAQQARLALEPYPPENMVAWQVSRRLYANKTPDDATLIEPVTPPNAASNE